MQFINLFDPVSAAIVFGGTLLATWLRCGWHDCLVALRCVGSAMGRRFDSARTRAGLALQVQEIHREGLLRAEPRHFRDKEFDEMSDALIEHRTIGVLLDKHRAYKEARLSRSRMGAAALNQAAELGPVLGLAGTLIALSQLTVSAGADTMLSSNIPTAIITTLYGLVAANLVFAPLARLVERRAVAEEAERQKLIDWLASELAREGVRQGAPRQVAAA